MSKQVTLATCIARMYEGGKLDNAGASGAGSLVKKPANTLLNSLSGLEVKLNLLDARVDQIARNQEEVLKKLDLVCQGLGSLERDVSTLKQERDSSDTVGGHRGDDLASFSEIKALYSETVEILQTLQQEGIRQREKLAGIESSVSTMDKVLGYIGNIFQNSKIVKYILQGIVPWRKGSLLESEDNEIKDNSEDKIVKPKVNICNQGTQVEDEFNEAAEAQGDVLCPASCDAGNKAPRKPKEVTLSSREPTRTQTFAKDAQDIGVGTEDLDRTLQKQAQEGSACMAVPVREAEGVVMEIMLERDQDISEEQGTEKREEHQESLKSITLLSEDKNTHTKDVLPAVSPQGSVTNVIQVHKDSMKPASQPEQPQSESEPKSPHEPDQSPNERDQPPALFQNKQVQSGPYDIARAKAIDSEEQPEQKAAGDNEKQAGLEVPSSVSSTNSTSGTQLKSPEMQLLVIDDCPPMPAPFEHRIVSAKQVPIGSYYAVKTNEVLGGGRFGQVHKCAELSSGLTLAAKIIKVKGIKDRDEVKNEIGVMNQLNHVNLIQLYDAFESRSNLTLIMEYVEGGELFDRIIDENYQLTELDAIVFTRQICEGVQYLHQQYILHLDLKPENILCVNNTGNQIKIIDFGLARKYRPREKLKVNFGTPEFLAPEVVNYDFVSFPTDMWSVGVITYMLLSGLSPFLGDNDTETMNNILHCNWDFDAEAFESVSEEAKDFISRLLIPEKCSRLSATGCMKHSWLNNLEEKAKMRRVRLKSQLRLQRYLAAHRQWKKHFLAVAAANRLKRFRQSHSVKPA
ncbi:myosin light chain kinase 3-like [Megalops cyprinoides]|uniref:myosin light chain kinase 3-like n=1 Tax=Megalops cyprinoides TaxID=118141 RepID=UPI0018643B6A|nr:myosin light chain kinase 3-like [Megalops cyprinoides]